MIHKVFNYWTALNDIFLTKIPSNSFTASYTGSARTTQKTQPLYCSRGVFTSSLYSNGRGADSIENAVILLLRTCVLRTLSSNGRCLQIHCIATGLYATILILCWRCSEVQLNNLSRSTKYWTSQMDIYIIKMCIIPILSKLVFMTWISNTSGYFSFYKK
jgi:hypothetical protein